MVNSFADSETAWPPCSQDLTPADVFCGVAQNTEKFSLKIPDNIPESKKCPVL